MHQPLIAAATAGRPAPAGPPPLRTEVVTDAAGLEGLAAEWERLAVAAGLEHPFLTHAWARTWWECFGAGRRPHVLVVREGQETVALAPLMACTRRICGVPARAIASMHNEHTPRFDLLVARRADEAYAAIWDRLLAARADWDLLEIAPVPAASPTLTALRALATRDGCRTGTWQGAPSPYVPLGGGWDALLRDLSHNRRAQMRKRLRRLERLGPVDLEVITAGPVVDEALEEGLRMEADGWKGRAGTAILCRGEVARFYRKLALAARADGSLQLLFLKTGGVRIAFAFALRRAGRMFVLKAGFRRDHAAHSPYQVLTGLVLRDACAGGLVEYDFLGGFEEWKRHWTKQARPHDWLYVFADSRRGRLLHALKFGLLPRLRRITRR